ncbi:protein of unknown function [Brevefilum fermentans]|uniref:Uncharacterized protein n=1 Tax=Candidatus Brevifilum fermentans TaxID=1986204 RepID=A0A1Y6K2Y2_9CHLR|nr:protein of unknown function [Brevefilum fermentans]
MLVFPQEGISHEVIKVRIEDLVLIAMDVLCGCDLRFDHDLLGKAVNFTNSAFSEGCAKEMATPVHPARPVWPMRCTKTSVSSGRSKLDT